MTEGLRRINIRVLTAVSMIFIFVSSGAFGLEDMLPSSGPGLTLIMLFVLLPVLWALPMALVCSELGSALPYEGGYYRWTKQAMGEFWGFQAGWWSWTCQWVDSAVYITLVLGYLQTWWPNSWPGLTPIWRWVIGAAIILVFTYINIRGLNIVAFSSVLFTVVIMAPFVVLTILGLAHWHGNPFHPFMPQGQSFLNSTNLGLAVGVWMYSGYDSMSVLAGEIRHPQRIIPRALMIALPLVVLSYSLPTLAGLAGFGHWADWATTGGKSFVEIGKALGGSALMYAMLGSAIISNMALYQDYLASGSRPAFAMADDGLLPKWLNRTHHKYGTPWVSIVLLAAVNLVLILGTFANLVIIDVMLMLFYYMLIFIAAVRLRQKEPDLERPFRIRGNTAVLTLICLPAVAILLWTLWSNVVDTSTTIWGFTSFKIGSVHIGWYGIGGFVAMVLGPIAYVICKKTLRPTPPVPAAAAAGDVPPAA